MAIPRDRDMDAGAKEPGLAKVVEELCEVTQALQDSLSVGPVPPTAPPLKPDDSLRGLLVGHTADVGNAVGVLRRCRDEVEHLKAIASY